MAKRESWNSYFLRLARHAATRATCNRGSVGCVIVDAQRRVLATGYNGALPGLPHCHEEGCDMHEGHCVRTIHAEANAIASAAARGTTLAGQKVTAYVTHFPCLRCAYLLQAAGVENVVYLEAYRVDTRVLSLPLNLTPGVIEEPEAQEVSQ